MPVSGRSPVHVAIIGAGFIAAYHAEGLRAAGGAEVAALVGRRRAAVEARARELAIPRAETDIRSVLEDPAIDAVVVATPDDSHETLAIAALQAGKSVLLQKPMALGSAGCRAILAAERASPGQLTVSFMHRYFPEVGWLRGFLAAGRLGRLHSVRIRNATPGADWNTWVYRPGAVAGGVAMQLGVHGIDLCRHLFGPILELTAQVRTALPARTLPDGSSLPCPLEDTVQASYRLAGDLPVAHDMSYAELAGCDRFRLEVYGDLGTVWLRTERGAAAVFAPEVTGERDWVVPALDPAPVGARQHRHWLEIARGEAPRDDTPEAGLQALVVAETIYRAARERAWLPVPGEDPARLS